MIYVLTIIIMFLIVWTIYSLHLVLDDDSIMFYSGDDILLRLSKIYWWIILVGIVLSALWFVSYMISGEIICHTSNSDHKVCKRIGAINEVLSDYNNGE